MSKDVFERDREFYQQRGIGNKMGFGKKPAVVVIDLQLGFTDPNFPLGGDLDRVVESCRKLIDAAHAKKIPVIFTTTGYEKHLKDAGVWIKKIPSGALLQLNSKWVEIDPRLGKTEDDVLVVKKYPSGFFGTHLDAPNHFNPDGLRIAQVPIERFVYERPRGVARRWCCSPIPTSRRSRRAQPCC